MHVNSGPPLWAETMWQSEGYPFAPACVKGCEGPFLAVVPPVYNI